MSNFKTGYKPKKKLIHYLYSKPVVVLLLVILFFTIKGVWGIYEKVEISEESLSVLEKEHEELFKRKEVAEEKVRRLETETGLEDEIRSKFDVSKHGEKVVVIVENKEEIKFEEEIKKDKSFIGKLIWWKKD